MNWRTEGHDATHCPKCRPVAFDMNTGKVIEEFSKRCEEVWRESSNEERRAWHRVTCLNSRDIIDVHLAGRIAERIQGAPNAPPTRN